MNTGPRLKAIKNGEISKDIEVYFFPQLDMREQLSVADHRGKEVAYLNVSWLNSPYTYPVGIPPFPYLHILYMRDGLWGCIY